jgi:hypothetical protein
MYLTPTLISRGCVFSPVLYMGDSHEYQNKGQLPPQTSSTFFFKMNMEFFTVKQELDFYIQDNL